MFSRFGNRVYLELANEKNVTDFDQYFDEIQKLDWSKYIDDGCMLNVKAKSIKSGLASEPALQSVAKKSIIKKIEETRQFFESENQGQRDVQILLQDDELKILLNTS